MQQRNKSKSRGQAQETLPPRVLAATASKSNIDDALISHDPSRQSHRQMSSSEDWGGCHKRVASKGKTSTENSSESENEQGTGNSGSEEPADSNQTRTTTSNCTTYSMDLRKGKWTAEEEEYTTRVIHYFSSGLIALPEGKTLRSYLAEKLMCDPMRITKKYAGASCLGKRIHNLCESPRFSPQEIEMAKLEIDRLEERFRLRLIQGVGAALPPLPSAPVNHGSIGSFNHARDQGIGCNGSTIESVVSTTGGQQQLPVESIPQVASSSSGTNRQQLSFNPPFPMSVTNGISGAPAPPMQSSQVTTSSLSSNNNPAAAFLASLTNNPQIIASLSNSSDFAVLMNGISQMTAPAPSQAASLPSAIDPSKSMTLQQILQQAMTPQSVQQSMQGQESQVATGSQFLHPFSSNSTPSAQYAQPPAELHTSVNLSNTSDNDKLAHALLAHITTQLHALAATSPSTLLKVQHQLLSSTLTSTPNLWAQVPPHNNINDPSTLLKTLQQLTSHQAPALLTQNTGYPGAVQRTGFPSQSYQQAVAQAFSSQQHQTTTNQNAKYHDPAELFQMLSAQQQQQHAPTQSAAARNLQSLIAAQQAAAADATNNARLANAYNMFMSNVAAASDNPQNGNKVTKENSVSSMSFQAQQSTLSDADALSKAISNLVKESQGHSIVGSNTGIDELVDTLRKKHVNLFSQVQSNEAERKHSSPFSFQHAKHRRESPESPRRKRLRATSKESTEQSSSREKDATASTKIDAPNEKGRSIKKRAKWAANSEGVQHTAGPINVSCKSGSSSQFDSEEKSTSPGDNPETDETENNQCTSSTSLSDDGSEDQVSIPPRKRFTNDRQTRMGKNLAGFAEDVCPSKNDNSISKLIVVSKK